MTDHTPPPDPPAPTAPPATPPAADADALTADFDRAIRLREEGLVQESCALLRRVVCGRATLEGAETFDTQCALSQLGRSLRALGAYEEATCLHRQVLRIRQQQYGAAHPYTLNSARILIVTLRLQGKTTGSLRRRTTTGRSCTSSLSLRPSILAFARAIDGISTRSSRWTGARNRPRRFVSCRWSRSMNNSRCSRPSPPQSSVGAVRRQPYGFGR